MSQLCLYLPPFASDYSGVCSALFDLNGMVVIHDASCCSRNYTGYDEPRWFGNRRPIFCSRLRETDAILGRDDKLIRKIINAYNSLEDKPEFIAIIGSPVPALIGVDIEGICDEIKAELDVPAVSFSTTGYSYYHRGVSAAHLKIVKMFAETRAKAPDGRIRVNVLGLTPLDFSDNENASDICAMLEHAGLAVNCSFFMNTSFERIKHAGNASVNLVVAQCGMDLAEYMFKEYHIPYVAGTPIGQDGSGIISALNASAEDGKNRVLGNIGNGGNDVLIIGDLVYANSVRAYLNDKYGVSSTVATFFENDRRLMQEYDIWLKEEKSLCSLLSLGKFKILIADPVIASVPEAGGMKIIPVAHVAVSSRLYWHNYPRYMSQEFELALSEAKSGSNDR